MRIIAGSAKGTRLAPVPGGTRPLSDRAREGLFSSLGPAVVGARWADLYAGTGAVGIEALSRGADSCLFVDAAKGAIRAIEANLAKTGLEERARVVHREALWAVQRERGPFDVAFLDPPYATAQNEVRAVLSQVIERMAEGGTIALTRSKRDATDVVPIHFRVDRLLTYGDARILVCREAA